MNKKTHRKFSKREIFFLLVIVILIIAFSLSILYKGDITNVFMQQPVENPPQDNDKIYTSFYSGNVNISLPQEFNEQALLEVHFIDVGQGDAILIRLPDGKDVFIDAGSGTIASAAMRESFSNYLGDMNLTYLEYLIITHAHSDHVNMADILVNNYDINNFIFHDIYEDASATYRNFVDLANEKQTEVYAVGEEWEFYNLESEEHNYSLDIYAPGLDFSNDTNSQSILCLLQYHNTKVLFTGDATKQTEEHFMSFFEDKDIDILKVGHHGSDTSTSEDFLDFFNPEFAIISVGETNPYNHPSPFLMNRLFNRGIITYRTNRQGDIVLYIDNNKNFGFLCQKSFLPDNNSQQKDQKLIILDNNQK